MAAKSATRSIPIVFCGVSDPVVSGLVPSLARPGGNLTGLANIDDELAGKRLGLLHELLPAVDTVAVLWNPDALIHGPEVAQIEAAARSRGLSARAIELRRPEDVGSVFERLKSLRPGAVLVLASTWHPFHGALIFSTATAVRLPTVGAERYHATGGALLTYGANFADLSNRAAGYVDKIFKGAKPADLPIERPLRYDLLINMKTAEALGIRIPEVLLLRADEVIR